MNTDLVAVTPATLGGTEVLTVNARDLHTFLGVGKRFASWITERIAEYEFTENQDFAITSQNREKIGRGRPGVDYILALDMAKELAMVERTDKGRQVRRYFIECEKRLSQVAPAAAPVVTAAAPLPSRPIISEAQYQELAALVGLLREDYVNRPAAGKAAWAVLRAEFGCAGRQIPAAQFERAKAILLGIFRAADAWKPAVLAAEQAFFSNRFARLPAAELDRLWRLSGMPPRVDEQGLRGGDAQALGLATALEDLLAEVRAGRVTGVAAVAFHSDFSFDTVVSHASAWNPLVVLGGIARLQRDVHSKADEAGW